MYVRMCGRVFWYVPNTKALLPVTLFLRTSGVLRIVSVCSRETKKRQNIRNTVFGKLKQSVFKCGARITTVYDNANRLSLFGFWRHALLHAVYFYTYIYINNNNNRLIDYV